MLFICTFEINYTLVISQSFFQRNFAGNRYSDHMAALNAFSCWEEARQAGETAEINFCDAKGLNMPTMRTTW